LILLALKGLRFIDAASGATFSLLATIVNNQVGGSAAGNPRENRSDPVAARSAHALPGVYPRGMAGKPAESSPPGRAQSARGKQEGEEERPGERCGPLAIARLAKDDGRALILYTRTEGRT
jgi:hypothetical protein